MRELKYIDNMKSILLQFIQNYIVHTSIWEALGITSILVYSAYAQNIELPFPAYLMVFLTVLFVYTLDRIWDSSGANSSTNNVEKYYNSKISKIVVVISGLFSVVLLTTLPIAMTFTVLSYCSIGIVYGLVLPIRKGKYIRLKDISGAKALIVGMAISVSMTLMPIAYTGEFDIILAFFVFGVILLNIIPQTIMCDIRDIEEDKRLGTPSIPILIGVKKTKWVLYILNILILVMLIVFLPYISSVVAIITIVIVMTSMLYIKLFDEHSSAALMSLTIDGAVLLYAIPMLINT